MTLSRILRSSLVLFYGATLSLLALAATPVHAAPWIEPGDTQLRSDIEVLARYGIIPNLTTTWPLPWARIESGINAAAGQELPNYVRLAIDRVRARMPQGAGAKAPHVEVKARYTNRPSFVRDFSEPNRQKIFAEAATEQQWGSTFIKLNIGYEGDQHHGVALPDGTYVAQGLGNWIVTGGYVPRWWGPGWDSSMFLSTNARDFPSFGISRQEAKPFGTKLLSWLGPWTFDMFAGVLDDPRYVPNTALIHMRFAFSPVHNLEIAFSRALMLCGSGRSCSASTIAKAFIGKGEHPTNGVTQDIGNQIANMDIRYTHRISDAVGGTFYLHLVAEDSAGPIPVKISPLGGASFDGALGDTGGRWRITGEYMDTSDVFFTYHKPYNILYEHHIYRSGYRYYGRALGASIDNDGRMLSLIGRLWDGDSRSIHVAYRYAQLNRDGTCAALPGGACAGGISVNPETIHMIEGGVELPTALGTFDLDGRLQSDSPNTPGVHDSAAAVEVGWKIRL